MNERLNSLQDIQDPCGLRSLPPLDPPADGWKQIESALCDDHQLRRRSRVRGIGLATAAVAVLAITLWTGGHSPAPTPVTGPVATNEALAASDEQEQTLRQLIAMSQNLEQQLRGLREGSGSIPASSAVYVAELEDLVAQVDNQISVSPDSINLWGQRVNLLLDLAQIYQHQWEREYGRMASL